MVTPADDPVNAYINKYPTAWSEVNRQASEHTRLECCEMDAL
jgi:hypothetical protein